MVAIAEEMVNLDTKAEQRINADAYGIEKTDAFRFLQTFVFPGLIFGRSMLDVLQKTGKHDDNPYLKRG